VPAEQGIVSNADTAVKIALALLDPLAGGGDEINKYP
jgi:hypothetical protein